jgi:hypothetical protein
VTHQLKAGIVQQVDNVVAASGEIIVKTNDFVAVVKQPFAQVGADKSGAAGN